MLIGFKTQIDDSQLFPMSNPWPRCLPCTEHQLTMECEGPVKMSTIESTKNPHLNLYIYHPLQRLYTKSIYTIYCIYYANILYTIVHTIPYLQDPTSTNHLQTCLYHVSYTHTLQTYFIPRKISIPANSSYPFCKRSSSIRQGLAPSKRHATSDTSACWPCTIHNNKDQRNGAYMIISYHICLLLKQTIDLDCASFAKRNASGGKNRPSSGL